MRKLLQSVSAAMLVLTVLFPVLFLMDAVSESTMKSAMLAVTIVWFAVTPLWMGRATPATSGGYGSAD